MKEQTLGSDLPYTNRELREKWNDMDDTLKRIEAQTTKTNGRVDSLELSRASQTGFYKAFAISGAIGWGIAMSIIGWMLLQLINLDSRIQIAVDNSLSAYDINK